MNFCIECGARLEGTRFCTSCGAPVEAFGAPAVPPDIPLTAGPNTAALAYGPPLVGGPYVPTVDPGGGPTAGPPGGGQGGGRQRGGPPTALVAVIAFALIAAVSAGGTMLILGRQDGGTTRSASPSATTGASGEGSTAAGPGQPGAAESPSAGASASRTSATVPDDVVLLSPAQATAQLEQLASRDAPQVAELAGSWVPQVSSKCQGLSVNLGSDYTPGGPRVDNVSAQQILGLHLAMQERHSALTTTAGSLGITSRPPRTCIGKTMWMVLVPQTYTTSGGALAWCQSSGFPPTECGARYVVAPGRSGTQFVN